MILPHLVCDEPAVLSLVLRVVVVCILLGDGNYVWIGWDREIIFEWEFAEIYITENCKSAWSKPSNSFTLIHYIGLFSSPCATLSTIVLPCYTSFALFLWRSTHQRLSATGSHDILALDLLHNNIPVCLVVVLASSIHFEP